jgi:hypothetical protein
VIIEVEKKKTFLKIFSLKEGRRGKLILLNNTIISLT